MQKSLASQSPSAPPQPLVVTIVAGAGDLAALGTILGTMAATENLAVIIAQTGTDGVGIPPKSVSALTSLAVVPLADGCLVEGAHLYIAPLHTVVGTRKGRFRTRPPRGSGERRSPVDATLDMLAHDLGPRLIGVVLSRDGSDGLLGLQAVRASGGMTMAQAASGIGGDMPARDGTPFGFVDYLLDAEHIGPALLGYLEFWTMAGATDQARQRRQGIEERLVEICAILRERTGVDFKHYRTTTLLRRIERRMHVLRLEAVDAYVERIVDDGQEAPALFRELLIGVTSFFRDPEAFTSLAENALKPLLEERSAAHAVRIWVPACATGEEAYSIAMLAREITGSMENPPRVQIFATDINERALAAARRGRYPSTIAANVSPERLDRFFIKSGRRYEVTPALREMVLFSRHNVIADPPFSRLDAISCRNLLIYLGPHLQKKLIPVFHYALRSGGYLLLGSSETLTGHGELFRDVDIRHRLAQRKDTQLPTSGQMRDGGHGGAVDSREASTPPNVDIGAVAQRMLLDEFAPRYAIVNEDGNVVYLSQGVDAYIQPSPGTFSNSIMRMARQGLSVGLRSAFGQALRERRTTVTEVSMRTLEGPQRVRLTVQPMPELGADEGLFMLVFQSLGSTVQARPDGPGREADADGVIQGLEQELTRVREQLDRTVQDIEAANEELKSANEELLSMNEELQSANEELETSKEDVQAAHDDLATVNADLENHQRATRIATIFLDGQGTIRGFTPAASDIYHLATGDVGRPLNHFTHVLVDPPPLPDVVGIGERSDPIEEEIRAADGRWFKRRVLPYRDTSGKVDGLVVTFIDVTTQKSHAEKLRSAEDQRRVALDAAAMGMWWWDDDAKQLLCDDRIHELLDVEIGQAVTRKVFLSRIHPDDLGLMRIAVDRAGGDRDRHSLEFRVITTGGSTRWLASIGQRQSSKGASRWSGVIFDITSRKQTEEKARNATELLDAVARATDDLIYVKDRDSRLLFANPAMLALTGQAASAILGDRMPGWHGREDEARAILDNDRRIIESGVGEVVEEAFTPPAGETRFFSSNKKPLLGPDGRVTGIVGVSSDITEYKNLLSQRDRLINDVDAERRRLAVSERNHRVLFEQAAVGIEKATLDGRLTAVNDCLCVMLGYSRDELLSKTFVDITDPVDLPRERRRHKRLISGKVDSYVFEKRYLRRNGTRLWARVTSSLARDEDGAILYRTSVIEDISERRRAQDDLHESEARYRATFEQAAVGIAHVGLDGRWMAVNERVCAITGYSREEMLGSSFQEITHPGDLDMNLDEVSKLIGGERDSLAFQKRYLRKDGAIVWVNVTTALVRRDDGAPAYMISVVEDITEDLRSASTDARLAAIVRSSSDAIYSFDGAGVIGSWNEGAERLFGYRAGEIIGLGHSLLVPSKRKQEAEAAIARLKAGELMVTFESERQRKDGSVFPCAISKSLIRDTEGHSLGFSSIVRDITDRREWEERQRLMARELVHRVKNSFAVIQSIVRQTQRSTPDPQAFATAIDGRLAAMAASHDLITDRHWRGAGLRELVTSQLAAFAEGSEKRIHVNGPDALLDTSLAVPLGLALHELATNAAKYGSLSKPGGIVELSWSIDRRGRSDYLSLLWRETGGPPVTPPRRRGFGTSLIERGLPDARIERRFDPEGFVCHIELPTSGVRTDDG